MRKWFAIACGAFVVFGTSREASAEIIWRGDFQTGDRSQWSSTEAVSTSRLEIVTSPVPEGYEYALKTIVRQGDTVYGGDRSELDYERDEPGEGDERYYHWKTYWPEDYKTADYWQLFTQWHQYVDGGSPPLAFMVWGEKVQLGDEDGHYYWDTPLVRGVWHDFVFHVVWSTDSSKGGIEVWYDGAHVLPLTQTATLFPNDTVYLKQGLYRKNAISWEQNVYHCGMTIGTELADMMPIEQPVDGGTGPITTPDAGVPPKDGGSTPATPDAGTIANTDSGTDPGSGGELVPARSGGCHTASAAWGGLLIAGLWWVRRRNSASR